MPTYVKRHWNETRGDEHDGWGTSWWYFEVVDDGSVLRQVEQYDSGVQLSYSEEHEWDEFGMLSEKPLDLSEPEYNEISREEFESVWRNSANSDIKP
jgi:hypothetical protein